MTRPMMAELCDTFFASGWIMGPISLCLILELVIIIERSLHLGAASMKDKPFLANVRKSVLVGDLDHARELASAAEDAALGRVVKMGLTKAHDPPELIQAAVHEAASSELRGLTRRLPVLKGLGMLALLFGVYGTVVELLPSFVNLADASASARSAWTVAQLSDSLASAVFGLAVILVAVVGHAQLDAWVRRLEDQLNHGSVMVLNLILDYSSSASLTDSRTRRRSASRRPR